MGLTLTLVATWEAVDILRFLQIEILMKLFLLVSSHPVKQKKNAFADNIYLRHFLVCKFKLRSQ